MSALTPLSLKTQVLRFVATGGFSAIVDYGIYTALHALGLSLDPAKAISDGPNMIALKNLSELLETCVAVWKCVRQ